MYQRPFFSVCHAGVLEYIVPIFHKGELVATLFIGQCTLGDRESLLMATERIERLGGKESAEIIRYYQKLPVCTKETLVAAGKLAELALSQLADVRCDFSGDSVAELAMHYINENCMSGTTLEGISEMLHVNPTYLSREFHRRFGITLGDHLTSVRIEQAKKLLALTSIPIKNISFNVGYSDPNYFARVFKRETGLTPLKYRKNAEK